MESSWGLALCGRGAVPEGRPGETIGESRTQLDKRPHHFRETSIMEWPPRTAAVWDVANKRLAVCVAEGRAGEVSQAPWRSLEDHV